MKRLYLAFIILNAFNLISSGCSNSNSQENLFTGTIKEKVNFVCKIRDIWPYNWFICEIMK